MKNQKMLSAFNAFEIKNQKSINGGAVITCTDGKICDIRMNDGTMLYDRADEGLPKGTALAEGRTVSSMPLEGTFAERTASLRSLEG